MIVAVKLFEEISLPVNYILCMQRNYTLILLVEYYSGSASNPDLLGSDMG